MTDKTDGLEVVAYDLVAIRHANGRHVSYERPTHVPNYIVVKPMVYLSSAQAAVEAERSYHREPS